MRAWAWRQLPALSRRCRLSLPREAPPPHPHPPWPASTPDAVKKVFNQTASALAAITVLKKVWSCGARKGLPVMGARGTLLWFPAWSQQGGCSWLQ